MKQFKIIIALGLLVSSVVILFITFFISQPVEIILETGQAVTTQNPNLFTLTKVLILVITSFFIGATITYLFYKAESSEIAHTFKKPDELKRQENLTEQKFDLVFPLLKHDERKVIKVLMDNKGDMLQNALVLETGLSKVKITRELSSLENKNLIVRERFGLTNKIKLVR
jgi:uncharacterized membrane protein